MKESKLYRTVSLVWCFVSDSGFGPKMLTAIMNKANSIQQHLDTHSGSYSRKVKSSI